MLLHHLPLFSFLQIFLTRGFLECWVLCLSEEWDMEEIFLLASTCFLEYLTLTEVIIFHSFIPLVGFLCLRVVFKSKSLIFWCADLLPFHLNSASLVSAQHYWKLASKYVTGSMCSLLALILAHLCWSAALVALNFRRSLSHNSFPIGVYDCMGKAFSCERERERVYWVWVSICLPFLSCYPLS